MAEREREVAHTRVPSSLYKGTNPIMRVSPSEPHLNSIASQQFYLQISIRFEARASMDNVGWDKYIHSLTVCVCVLLMRESYMGLGCEELYIPGRIVYTRYIPEVYTSTLMWDSAETFGQSVFQRDFESVTGIQQFWDFYLVSFPLAEVSVIDSVGLCFRSFCLISTQDEGLRCRGVFPRIPWQGLVATTQTSKAPLLNFSTLPSTVLELEIKQYNLVNSYSKQVVKIIT